MRFNFKAVKPTGEHYEGVRETSDKLSLYKELEKEGNTVISVVEENTKHKKFSLQRILPGFLQRVGAKDKIMFAKSLGTMLEAGLPMARALSVMERQARDKKLKSVFSKIRNSVSQGKSLNEALSQFPNVFPELFISMVKAGEESGSVSGSLKSVGSQMERTHLLVRKLRGAMIYPAIVLTAMVIITVLLLVYLVPILSETFESLNLELPLSTKIVIVLSNFLQNNAILSIIFIIASLLGFFIFIKTSAGKKSLDFLLLHLPIVKTLVKESNSARTSRTLSSLLTAGVDFLIAIRITKDVVQNSYYKKVLEKGEETVRKGGTISSTFLEAERLYPPFVGEMASIGEETGKLSEMLSNTADFFEEAINEKTKNISAVIEPILVVIIGIFVAIFALAMLGPIYSLVGSTEL
jgi:type IV pilus assembly protein PilC